MFQTFEQARRYLDDQNIQMVDLKFTDLWGRWHHLTVPARSIFTPAAGEWHRIRRLSSGLEERESR